MATSERRNPSKLLTVHSRFGEVADKPEAPVRPDQARLDGEGRRVVVPVDLAAHLHHAHAFDRALLDVGEPHIANAAGALVLRREPAVMLLELRHRDGGAVRLLQRWPSPTSSRPTGRASKAGSRPCASARASPWRRKSPHFCRRARPASASSDARRYPSFWWSELAAAGATGGRSHRRDGPPPRLQGPGRARLSSCGGTDLRRDVRPPRTGAASGTRSSRSRPNSTITPARAAPSSAAPG